MTGFRRPLTSRLENAPSGVLTLYAVATAFCVYFCMYAFRKPFAAAKFEGAPLGQVELKTAFAISQIVGYALSKYLGIVVCSGTTRAQRAPRLLLLVALAQAALVAFALAPPRLKVVAMFFNGLPLGMVWGMVVSYLEGRRRSDLLLAGLSCSFIVSSSAVKDAGRWLMARLQIGEFWMPAATGFVFLPAFVLFVWLLDQVPQPDAADVQARVSRRPMTASDRRRFLRRFLGGLVILLVAYFALTAYRDFRDNYGAEILEQLGYGDAPAIFTRVELPVAFGVMIALAGLNLVKDNRRGLFAAFTLMAFGTSLLGAATLLWANGSISGKTWLTLTGLGSYLAYVPFNSVLFDRLIAATGAGGTAVFGIYLADAVGYTGSVALQLYKDLAEKSVSRLHFFGQFTYAVSGAGTLLLVGAAVYFLHSGRMHRRVPVEPVQSASDEPAVTQAPASTGG